MPDVLKSRRMLALGGARSGKSGFARRLAEQSGRELWFIATAEAGDGEMADRIARHRAERGPEWTTLEAPLGVAEALRASAGRDRIVLLDCATLWLSNAMMLGRDLEREIALLADALAGAEGPIIVVSNEVGSGLVPVAQVGRRFRDAQGLLNQTLARVCDTVVLVTAGLPRVLKPLAQPTVEFY